MRVELTTLLRKRDVVHPSHIVHAALNAGNLVITVRGTRWWDTVDRTEGELSLEFINVQEGHVDVQLLLDRAWDEALDQFDARLLADEEWPMTGTIHSTYCRQPIPDSMAIYAIVHDFLAERRAPLGPGDYLNNAHTMSAFRTITGKDDYLLSRAPTPLHALIEDELRRQSVEHSVLQRALGSSSRVLVVLGNGSFVCDEAIARWN